MADLPADLLSVLDMLVRADRNPSGLRAHVCIGVRRGEDETWWEGRFGDPPVCRFVDEPSPDADALLLMGADEADSLLHTGELPNDPRLLAVQGDRAILKKVIRRYTAPSGTAINLRAEHGSQSDPTEGSDGQ